MRPLFARILWAAVARPVGGGCYAPIGRAMRTARGAGGCAARMFCALVFFLALQRCECIPGKRILVFGATGRTGRRVLAQALAPGSDYAVSAFVRDRSKVALESPKLRLIQGDVLDRELVLEAVQGHDIVISALGKLGPAERVEAIENILEGMRLHGVTRIVAIGGVGCLQITESMRLQESPSFPRFFLKTSQAHWEVCLRLEASDLDWTFVCAPEIPDDECTGNYTAVASFVPGNKPCAKT